MNNKVIYKPWGSEHWLELNDKYCYKRIYINAGHKTSYQYHEKKIETNYLIEGKAEIWLENEHGKIETFIMEKDQFFTVPKNRKHRVIAITNIILQEVSTPEVDDVIRIEDDTQRGNGKITDEHKTPSVLILAAGLGSRLRHHTIHKNKALIPINNKAIISYIIEKFPIDYKIIIAVGYQKDSLKEYCALSHKDREIIFIEVDQWANPDTDPGYSVFLCKRFLQNPFYIVTTDCLISSDMPIIDGNWIGTYPTDCSEKYATINIDSNKNVVNIINKSKVGHEHAFIGLAAIYDYTTFWNELENNTSNYELVSAWSRPEKFLNLKTKELEWFDTGNIDDLKLTKKAFCDTPVESEKDVKEVVYKINDSVLKFNPNPIIISNKTKRYEKIKEMCPKLYSGNNFISYQWIDGNDLYEHDSYDVYKNFLDILQYNFDASQKTTDPTLIKSFYIDKTISRKNLFENKYGNKLLESNLIINKINYKSINHILSTIDYSEILDNTLYSKFHGDLHFDNIIYDKNQKYFYIDWRESFGGNTDYGDIYYDLAKLYCGCLFPFNLLKNNSTTILNEGISMVDYSYPISNAILKFTKYYENWIVKNNFSLKKVKLIAGLAFLNISPLHTDIHNKILLYKSIEILNTYA